MPNIGELSTREELIALRVEAGDALAEIERDLAAEAPWLDEDERAALWLYAWSYRSALRGGRDEGETPLSG